ncbi:hypothetical protein V1525DRAFT_394543 [Lipomyces kononenkoae]|uniref:Uncharacterized protein n=1 Tax=Lipomyces kononenkoae TaxID=34357 RepID=A0ACC3T9N1_LIPKO
MSQPKKLVAVESHDATTSMRNPPSTPSTNRNARKAKEIIIKSSTKTVLVVSTPSTRQSTMSPARTDIKVVSPTRGRVIVSPIRRIKATSPTKSSIPQPPDPKSMLRVKAQRDVNLAVANSARKDKDNARLPSPMKSELGKPQRLFSNAKTRTNEGSLCMNGPLYPSRRRLAEKLGAVPQLRTCENQKETVLGLKSPARRLGCSPLSKCASKSHLLPSASTKSADESLEVQRKLMSEVTTSLSSMPLSPPMMPPLSSGRSITKKNMKDMKDNKALGGRMTLKSDESESDEETTEGSLEEEESMLATPSKVADPTETPLHHETEDVNTIALEEALEHLDIESGPSLSTNSTSAPPSYGSSPPTATKSVVVPKTKSTKDLQVQFKTSTSKVPIRPSHVPTPRERSVVKANSPAMAVSERMLRRTPATQPRARIAPRPYGQPPNCYVKESSAKGCMEPLSDVVAFLDIRNSEGDDASAAFEALLRKLGAKIVKLPSRSVTHIVFKHGSPRTLRVAKQMNVPCVSISWVIECGKQQLKLDQATYAVGRSQARLLSPRKTELSEPTSQPQGLNDGKERTCVDSQSPNKGKDLSMRADGDELHFSAPQRGLPRLPLIDMAETNVDRRKSLTHAPTLSSPLARRSWSVEDLHSDNEKE